MPSPRTAVALTPEFPIDAFDSAAVADGASLFGAEEVETAAGGVAAETAVVPPRLLT